MQTTTLKLSAGLVALLLAGGAAGAADLGPITYNKAAPPIAAPITDWTGFYSGIHGGYGWGNAAIDDTTLFANPTQVLDADEAAKELAGVLPDLSLPELKAKLSTEKSFVWLQRNLTPRLTAGAWCRCLAGGS